MLNIKHLALFQKSCKIQTLNNNSQNNLFSHQSSPTRPKVQPGFLSYPVDTGFPLGGRYWTSTR